MSGSRCWTIEVDWLGRPTLSNAVHRMHHHQVSANRKLWRQAGCVLARAQRIPTMAAIEVECWGRYPSRRSLPDADAVAPALKGVIDGLVDARVIPDDDGDHLAAVTYRRPVVRTKTRPALVVLVREAPSPWLALCERCRGPLGDVDPHLGEGTDRYHPGCCPDCETS